MESGPLELVRSEVPGDPCRPCWRGSPCGAVQAAALTMHLLVCRDRGAALTLLTLSHPSLSFVKLVLLRVMGAPRLGHRLQGPEAHGSAAALSLQWAVCSPPGKKQSEKLMLTHFKNLKPLPLHLPGPPCLWFLVPEGWWSCSGRVLCGQPWLAERSNFLVSTSKDGPIPWDLSFLSLSLWLLQDFLVSHS